MSPSWFLLFLHSMLVEVHVLMHEASTPLPPPQTEILGLIPCGRGSLSPSLCPLWCISELVLLTTSAPTISHHPKCLLPGESSCRECRNNGRKAEIGGTVLTVGLNSIDVSHLRYLQCNCPSIPSHIQTVGTSTPLSPLVPFDRLSMRPTVSPLKSVPSLACK